MIISIRLFNYDSIILFYFNHQSNYENIEGDIKNFVARPNLISTNDQLFQIGHVPSNSKKVLWVV